MTKLQWGGRFTAAPDPDLIAFGSSLEEDLVLAPFDVRCSHAHVMGLEAGGILSVTQARDLHAALDAVADDIESGAFAQHARAGGFEDVHGAIDARVRERAPQAGESLHAGRSRNDQVATTLALYARERAKRAAALCAGVARYAGETAKRELEAGTMLAATTHWQPAQPVLLAFYLQAIGEMWLRSARRFARVADDAALVSPLGSGAVAGSSLPLDRKASAAFLGFAQPSRNAMDAIGTRETALDLAHAFVRATVDASRASEEFVIWCTPAFGYARLADSASTGSSLMPQKRNPDPFELVRSQAAALNGIYAGALGTLCGVALSYHRDLQTTKRLALDACERGLAALQAFDRAFRALSFNRERMNATAGEGFTVATDVADALIREGSSAREAHAEVGKRVAAAEAAGRALEMTPQDSIDGKRTLGSTAPQYVARAIDELLADVEELERRP